MTGADLTIQRHHAIGKVQIGNDGSGYLGLARSPFRYRVFVDVDESGEACLRDMQVFEALFELIGRHGHHLKGECFEGIYHWIGENHTRKATTMKLGTPVTTPAGPGTIERMSRRTGCLLIRVTGDHWFEAKDVRAA